MKDRMTFQIFGCHFKLSETKNSTLTKLDGDYQEQRLAKKKQTFWCIIMKNNLHAKW